MYLNGYKCLNRHVVHMRHQHELQKSLQIRWRIAAVSEVFRSPNASMLSVQLSHNPLYQRAYGSPFSLLTSSRLRENRTQGEDKDRNFSRTKISNSDSAFQSSELPVCFLMAVTHFLPHLSDTLHLVSL